jgi:hypothetical protein
MPGLSAADYGSLAKIFALAANICRVSLIL